MRNENVLIVGAGPTGLTMAIELHRFGIPVRLIDKADRPARWSQALVVQARTLEQFERYGIADRVVAAGRKLQHASVISEGKTIVSFPFKRIRSLYPFVLFLAQSETERFLIEHLRELGVEVERSVELVSLNDRGDAYSCQLRHGDGRIEMVEAGWVIGCDGAHSRVRELLHVPFGGSRVAQRFYLGDLELEGPDKLGDELRVYLHSGDVVFMGHLNDKEDRVIVALHSKQDTEDLNKKLTLADFQEPMDRAGIKLKVVSASWMTPFHVNDRQAAHIRINGAFLAGDASHIHSPVGGQGMNTGIQDVANLAWKLAAVRDGADSSLLDTYEEERSAVGKELLERTSAVLKAGTEPNPILEKIRDAVASVASRIPQVQQAAVGFVSETAIHYRGSSAFVDCGGSGSIHAADRMPNLEFHSSALPGRLLDSLRNSRHLTIAVDCEDNNALRSVTARADFLPINLSLLPQNKQEELRRLCGQRSVFVVRPDGYVGFRGRESDVEELKKYSRRVALN